MIDLQKANIMKRFAAWLIDSMLVAVLAVGFGFVLSLAFGYDNYNDTVTSGYAKYETEYGVTFNISQDSYQAMTEQQRSNYDTAYAALISDAEILHAYNMVVSLSLLVISLSLLLACFVLEFLVPLWFKNGQTIGKRVFSLAVIRTDGVQLTTLQLFVRSILGKFTVETMIPTYILLMIFWGTMGVVGLIVLAALIMVQIIMLTASSTNASIHDSLACTVVVDYPSQRIFNNTDELIEYTKRIHAEQASRQDY